MACIQYSLWQDSAVESRLDRYTDPDPGKKPALLVIPGGGYGCVCETTEGRPIAECFQKFGFRTFVLRYRVAPHRYPEPQQDALRAIKLIASVMANAMLEGKQGEQMDEAAEAPAAE